MNKDCYKRAIRLLTQRDYSRPKLCKKLVSVGFAQEDSEQVVEKLYAEGLLKEQWYIEARIRGLMRKGYSSSHIQQRLEQEQLSVEINQIDELFIEYGHNEEDQLTQLIQKNGKQWLNQWPQLANEERQKVKQKLMRKLVSKGFNPSKGLSAIECYFNAN